MVAHVFEEGGLVLLVRGETVRDLVLGMHLLKNAILHLRDVQSLE